MEKFREPKALLTFSAREGSAFKKIIRMVRFTLFCFFLSLLQVMAVDSYSQTRLSLNQQNQKLEDVLKTIEDKSEFFFLYNRDLINVDQTVNINKKDQTITVILDELLKGTDIKYSVVNRQIILSNMEGISGLNTQQQKSVSGKVSESSGAPMPGVSVVVKGTTAGTITDANGNYSIKVPENAILQFSFIGMNTQEIAISEKTTINVVLAEGTTNIEEVVAVGYGTMKKSDISGSVSSITLNDYKNQPVTEVSQTLKGLASGVSVTQVSGNPGGDVKIRIRGANSMLGNNDPLFVVDGVQMANVNFNDLNPSEIESLEILKDASACAIYGSRGANGVVLITTKHGSKGIAKVTINSFMSFRKSTDYYKPMGVSDFIGLNNYIGNAPGNPRSVSLISPMDRSAFVAAGGTDWQKLLVQNGLMQSHEVAVSGGTETTNYYFSGVYTDETGVVIETNRKKISFKTNIETKVNERLALGLNITGSQIKGHNLGSNQGGNIYQSITLSPLSKPYNSDGSYLSQDPINPVFGNPYKYTKEAYYDNTSNIGLINANLNYKILSELIFNSVLGININGADNGNFNNLKVSPGSANASRGYFYSSFWQTSNTLTFAKTIGDIHKLTAMAGFEESKLISSDFNAANSNLQTENGTYNNLIIGTAPSVSSSYNEGGALRSYLGRVSYALKDRYLLTATIRRDGSSKFKGSNKWSSFPSFALGWRLSEEGFIKNLNFLNNLKLRASYGKIGNQAINSYGTSLMLTEMIYRYGTTNSYPGYSPVGAANPNIKWETTATTNFGIDASFFQSRLNIVTDYYIKKTTDLLQYVPIPEFAGGGSKTENIGSIQNNGFELSFNIIPVITNDFKWDVTFNFWTGKNKILSLGDVNYLFPNAGIWWPGNNTNIYVSKVGEPIGTFWGFKSLGLWKSSEASEAALNGQKPGDYKYQDLNGDHKIDGSDMQVNGPSIPTVRWGFNTNIIYRGFTLNAFIEGVSGALAMNYPLIYATNTNSISIPTLQEGLDYWTPSRENAKYANPISTTNDAAVNVGSSQWLQSSNYIKLKNLSLSYDIPKKQAKIGDLKLYVSGQNLFSITKFYGGDPENSITGGNDAVSGYNAGSYPSVRTFTIGLKLEF